MSSPSASVSRLWSQAPRRAFSQRLVQFAPTRLVLALLFVAPAVALEIVGPAWGGDAAHAAIGALVVLALLLCLAAFARVVERRRLHELSLRRGFVEWTAGLGLGLGLLSVTVGVLVLAQAYRVECGGTANAVVWGLLRFVPQSLLEEILFRAILFKIAEESMGSWAALAFEALLFGAVHLANPGATALGGAAIALEGGVMLTAAYMLTRRLWLVWGIHVGWNFAQGSIFGIQVSGTPSSLSWLHSRATGSVFLTGGDFGVEASPIAVLVCGAAAIGFLWLVVRRGHVVSWKEQRERLRSMSAAQSSG